MKLKRGFTLVEILVVIAILAMLVIIAVPNILKTVKKNKESMFVTQAKNIYKEAIQEYILSSEEYSEKNKFYYSEVSSESPLILSGSKEVYYDIEINSDEVTKFIVWDKNYSIELEGFNIKLKDITLNSILGTFTFAKQIETGYDHAVYLMGDNSVRASGYNYYNQLSIGIDGDDKYYPVNVKKNATVNLGNVKEVAAGRTHTAFLLEDGTVWIVGDNNKIYPVQVKKDASTYLTNVKAISAGSYFTVLLMNDKTVWAVGRGALGNGSYDNAIYPVQVKKSSTENLINVKSIATSNGHTVYLLEDGTVWAVGDNYNGQLGNGTTTNSYYAIQVKKDASTYLTNVKDISAVSSVTAFLLNDGTVWAVGNNYYGQLGDGTTTKQLYPVQVKKDASSYLTNVIDVKVGFNHIVYLMTDGTVWSVGGNNYGQLGDRTLVNSLYPVQAKKDASTNLINVKEISAGEDYTLYLLNDGTVWGVGYNSGTLSNGTFINENYLVQAKKDADTYLSGVSSISTGEHHTAFLLEDKTSLTAGWNVYGQLGDASVMFNIPIQVKEDMNTFMINVKKVSAGENYTAYLKENGTVWAVGNNGDGQLGDGTNDNRKYPVQMKKDASTYLTNVKDISVGYYHIAFLFEDKTAWTLGANYSGKLGDGTTASSNYPVQVKKDASTYLTGVKAISASYGHTVILLEDGTVWSAGGNYYGKLGNGTTTNSTYATQVRKDASTYLTGVKAIAAGEEHTIYLLEDGTVWAAGYNGDGQLGDGTTTNRAYAVQVKKDASTYLLRVKSISAGDYHSIFLLENGTALAVGANYDGQLGDGTTTDSVYPIQVKKDASTYLSTVKEISAGAMFTIYLLENGRVYATGWNGEGQLGDGTNEEKLYPVKVILN